MRTDARRSHRVAFGAVWLLAAACAPAAHADTLYKCLDDFGLTTIQHVPCPKGQKQVWERSTTPEPPPTPEELAEQQARREQADRDAALRATRRAAEAKRAAEAEQMQQEVADAEKAQADVAAQNAGVVDAQAPPPTEGEAVLDEKAAREKECADAKQFALDIRAKPWIDLDEAQWQRLYGWVVQQCRGTPRR